MLISDDQNNPFPGLRPYEADQAELFFGRDEQIAELLDQLNVHRFVGVVGTSGSGKSSLVRAGLIPAIHRGYLVGPVRRWRIVIFRPGSGPLSELAQSLAKEFGLPESLGAIATLCLSNAGLVEFARANLGSEEGLFLVVDQFEELFRYGKGAPGTNNAEETAGFVKLLLAATGHSALPLTKGADVPVYVILTMRSDFLGQCARFRGLPEALNNAQYLVPRLTREQQREAIEGPIGMEGARITPQLVQRLLNDVGDDPDQLPVLQHALMRTWDQATDSRSKGEPIDFPHYESSGAMKDTLDRDVERVFQEVDPSDRALVRRIFQRLVESSAKGEETRRPSPLSELVAVTGASEAKVREILKPFLSAGFLTLSQDDDPIVDISHESLIRLWKSLKLWVAEEATSAQIYERLAGAARRKARPYQDPDLAEALRWRKDQLPNAPWAARYTPLDSDAFDRALTFLERSEADEARRVWLKKRNRALLIAGLAASSALAVLATIFAIRAHRANVNAADSQRKALVQKLGILADAKASVNGKFDQSGLLLAVESLRRAHTPDEHVFAARAIQRIIARSPIFVTRMKHDGPVTSLTFSYDGKQLFSGSEDRTARLWSLPHGEQIGSLLHPLHVTRVLFSRDEGHLATAGGEPGNERTGTRDSVGFVRTWAYSAGSIGAQLSESPFPAPVTNAMFDHEGTALISTSHGAVPGNASIRISRKPVDGPEVAETVQGGSLVSLSESGTLVAVLLENGKVQILEGKTLRVLRSIKPEITPESILLGDNILAVSDGFGSAELWDPRSGKAVSSLDLDSDLTRNSLSAKNNSFATLRTDGGFSMYDAATGKKLWDVGASEPETMGTRSELKFSGDGRLLAISAGDLVVRIYDVAERRERFRINVDTPASAFAFSEDGKSFAVGDEHGEITVWDISGGSDFRLDSSAPIFSPAATLLLHFLRWEAQRNGSSWTRPVVK